MNKLNFTKMVASGNDFVVTEKGRKVTRSQGHRQLAKELCDRKFGIGADGLLLLEKSRQADVKMRIFNADGSEAKMCGNGARCVALFIASRLRTSEVKIETKAGIIAAKVHKDLVSIKLTKPRQPKLDIPLAINRRILRVNFIDTGVPHAVIFTAGLDRIDIVDLARLIRYHQKFAPSGTNVDFIEVLTQNSLRVRTYERGVEGETLACGTGAVASALIFSLKGASGNKISLHTQGGEILKVYFVRKRNDFEDVWLEGKAKIVYKGEYNV